MDNEARSVVPAKFITVMLVAFLIIGLSLYFIPWPTEIAVRSTCVEVDRKGNILSAEGEIVLEGTYCNYLFQHDRFELTHLELPNVEVAGIMTFNDGGPVRIIEMQGEYNHLFIPCGFYERKDDGTPLHDSAHFSYIFTDPNFQYLLFMDNSEEIHYYVTTAIDDPSPAEILEEFGLTHPASD